MFKFENEQKIFHIGDVEVGGQPGELPTVLIGTIFYHGDKIVENEKTGAFDKQKAEEFIEKQSELSEKTCNPVMLDVVGTSPEAICKYIDFVANLTDAPILVDSSFMDVKIEGIKHAAEVGLLNRIVYNSIWYKTYEEELTAIKEVGVKSALLLTFNPSNAWPKGRLEMLYGKESNDQSLLKIAEKTGVENTLIDGATFDVPSVGLVAEAATLIKQEFGLPAGGAPCNAVLEWTRVKEYGKLAKKICMACSVTVLQRAGADFILYGPIKNAEIIFPAAAMTDAIIAYAMRKHKVKTRTREHPLYKIF
ncbi:tetrahydromethanopterin S-methyltransferase subunit H [Candidatus Borrarchaeum sp.]|uniref:tetrahydromethanopterin S-methyltransferase subunit H n=1 Tax=Candidatus Borrarchaeum sp. TaxID=2846742 RepID=UPI002579F326|nr:tetrahydromethanopterin S-methyltransferase subunit H [Candidatus Borrarchaeum sp.]